MKKLTFIFFLVFIQIVNAQNYRAIYNFEFKQDSLSTLYLNSRMILDIQKKDVKFYFSKLLKLDSLTKEKINVSFSFPIPQIIKRKTSSFKNDNYIFAQDKYFNFSSEDKMTWKIKDSIKYINNLKVQKAELNFGGRNWIAWFCNEIPFAEGPYKFKGLPGLIVEIQDIKNNFKYILISFQKLEYEFDTHNVVETNLGLAPIEITREQYNELLLNEYFNPFSEYSNMKDGTWEFQIFDKSITTQQGLKEIIKDYQQEIKKKYNPIELNHKIIYK